MPRDGMLTEPGGIERAGLPALDRRSAVRSAKVNVLVGGDAPKEFLCVEVPT